MVSSHETPGVVTRAFELLAEGDVSLFSPGYTHLGYDVDGRPRVFEGLNLFLEMMAKIPAAFEVFENDWVMSQAVGDELVVGAVRVRRKTHDGREFEGLLAMSFRVEDGVVTRGCDLVTSAGEAYWSSLNG